MKPADKRYCPDGFTCGTIVLANPDDDVEVPAYLIGGVGIHRLRGDPSEPWTVSAIGAGRIISCTTGDKATAAKFARVVANVIDWSKVSRARAGPIGWTVGRSRRVRGALRRAGAQI